MASKREVGSKNVQGNERAQGVRNRFIAIVVMLTVLFGSIGVFSIIRRNRDESSVAFAEAVDVNELEVVSTDYYFDGGFNRNISVLGMYSVDHVNFGAYNPVGGYKALYLCVYYSDSLFGASLNSLFLYFKTSDDIIYRFLVTGFNFQQNGADIISLYPRNFMEFSR